MEHKQVFKQMIEFNKATFENAFNTMVLLQDQAEKLAEMASTQAPWIPSEVKRISDEWLRACRIGRENFKRSIDEGFRKAESFFACS